MYNLFLDDIRMPHEAYEYTKQKMFLDKQWVIVRNYDEFVDHITEHGMPVLISFDHDLADEHYTPEEYWHDYELSKKYQDAQNYVEHTGLSCAKWLIEFCLDTCDRLPEYYSHSQNTVGKDNILRILDNYARSQYAVD